MAKEIDITPNNMTLEKFIEMLQKIKDSSDKQLYVNSSIRHLPNESYPTACVYVGPSNW